MKQEKLLAGALIALAAGFLVLLFAGNHVLGTLQGTEDKNKAILTGLKADIAQLEEDDGDNTAEEEPLSAEEQKAVLHSAAEAGQKVADCQNTYRTVDARSDREAFDANVEAMGALLTEESQNARVRWYNSETPGTWEFVTDGQFDGDALGVLWLCTNPDDGSLVGYATGTYHADSGLFSHIFYAMTMKAASNVPQTGEGEEKDLTVDDLPIDEINNADVGDIPDQSEEDLSAIREAQEQLRKQHQDQ